MSIALIPSQAGGTGRRVENRKGNPLSDDEDMQSKVARVQRLALEAEAEAVAEDGTVRVVAGPGGQVKELDLRLKAFQLSGAELGPVIVETMKAAMQQVERELSAEVNQIMGSMVTNDEESSR